ncbi:TRAP-type mannitol/chloroaromatic compound transport system, small permease component [Hartmannibacter diazotrophicus]|uniref:TRAP transporter small permease protein n=1 Tax=Hartmannibacter diazotrophicus TaxID=1482074 RepID=A0A2C9D413_9HYPH|nr:TRAP transporter small permease [Hartmannibacter diazotrophicus]SON54973.1 TRAP-type mannitol/chloroaromatic compound transport system, small permease component [Hartmannibacter diazotrophicus]
MALPEGEFEMPREERYAIPEAGWLGKAIDKGGLIFALGLLAAMLILIQEVVLRYVFNAPTIWAHETTVFLCALAFVYGGLYCTARDSHIRVVLIYDAVSPTVRRGLDVIISIISAIASAFFAWASWELVKRAIFRPDGSIHLETSGSAWDPPFPALLKLFLLAVMAVMTVQFVILAINHARRAVAKREAR